MPKVVCKSYKSQTIEFSGGRVCFDEDGFANVNGDQLHRMYRANIPVVIVEEKLPEPPPAPAPVVESEPEPKPKKKAAKKDQSIPQVVTDPLAQTTEAGKEEDASEEAPAEEPPADSAKEPLATPATAKKKTTKKKSGKKKATK